MKKKLFIAGNWKSFKSLKDADDWLASFAKLFRTHTISKDVTVILCPPYTLLAYCSEQVKSLGLPIELGGQDVSPFTEGAYTGEINAKQLSEFADWTIVGHSERRKNLGETDNLLFKKVDQAKEHRLKVLYCVQNETVAVPQRADVIAYEPPWAISAVSGWKAENPESAERICAQIAAAHPHTPILYGGSSSPENIISYLTQPSIWGVLSGGASLDPVKFFSMIESAALSG